MPKYDCEIRNSRGELIKTVIEAENMQRLACRLAEKKFSLVKATVVKESHWLSWFGAWVPHEEVVMFTVQLQTMLSTSIPLVEAVTLLAAQTDNRFFQTTLETMVKDMKSGKQFSAALRQHPAIFTPGFCTMIEIGEVGGNLDQVLVKLAIITATDHRRRAKFWGARLMLAIQIGLAVGGVLLLLDKVFPNFTTMIAPAATFREPGLLGFGVILGIMGTLWSFSRTNPVPPIAHSDAEAPARSDAALVALQEASEETPIMKLVNLVLLQAVTKGAVAIHIEPDEGELRVRYRIDGTLRVAMNLQPEAQSALVTRLKFLGGMDVSKHSIPQDGRFSMMVHERSVDFSVHIIPVAFGEKLCISILDRAQAPFELETLSLSRENDMTLRKALAATNGIILVTGPSGSGMTTTLYACLNAVKGLDKNICTAENPVEYRQNLVNQIPVRPESGLDFRKAHQAILRQDPDVILLGDIREAETARIAVEAALAGHLVFAGLYTSSAPGSVGHLINMGLEPNLLAATLRCVVSLRLARSICKNCKDIDNTITPDIIQRLGLAPENISGTYFRGRGCEQCFQSGYRGRFGVHEVMLVNDRIRHLLLQKASVEDLRHAARENGMKTLREDLTAKFTQGLTTSDEVLAVVRTD
ncbi:MAG: ATPase, T2SS/T4P/T4SS family [Candidatus Ozemobacteraceae bacterium]